MYSDRTKFFKELDEAMPAVFSRQEASRLIGNIISSGTLRNLDSKKQGPANQTTIGKKVCYEKKSFIDWLKNYKSNTSNLKRSNPGSHQKPAYDYSQIDSNFHGPTF
jgi:hypothetical protein